MIGQRATGILDFLNRIGGDLVTPPQASPVDRESSPLQQAMNRPTVQVSQPSGSVMATNVRGGPLALASTTPQVQAQFNPAPQQSMPRPPAVMTVDQRPELNQEVRPQQSPLGQGQFTPEMLRAAPQQTPDISGLQKLAEDASKIERQVADNPQLEQDPTFMDRVRDYFGSRENMTRLALAFNSMRLNPDQGLAAALKAEQKDLRAQSQQRRNATRTAAVVREKDPRLAALLEQGVIDAKTAVQLMYKSPSELSQMMELFRSDPETFKAMAASGAFGGDVDFGQGKMFDEMARQNIETRNTLIQGGTNARSLMNDLMRFQMQAEGMETGPLEQRLQSLREFGSSIGIPVDDVRLSAGQSLNAAAFELVAKQLRQNKGPQTDFDAEFTSRFVPSLGNTNVANQEITNYLQSANRLMTIYGSQAGEMPIDVRDADKFLMDLQRSQQNTPAVTKFNDEWITFEEYYQEAKRLSRETGRPLSDMQIVEQWTKDHREMGQL